MLKYFRVVSQQEGYKRFSVHVRFMHGDADYESVEVIWLDTEEEAKELLEFVQWIKDNFHTSEQKSRFKEIVEHPSFVKFFSSEFEVEEYLKHSDGSSDWLPDMVWPHDYHYGDRSAVASIYPWGTPAAYLHEKGDVFMIALKED